ncbi:hypothetical protein FQB35_05710 [Crassaminicella thermophila]|uniref:Uncharacterized protein n=1 Tax=Crassaminicella thermophila TaxID=2599308 RepID=A0A5C0SBB3_CRATE|nr:hypothetical protein [Crassaminicella thermophila]QEK11905.1 hypothetical protein FQB35_05710 [Crassaminicella thermophila]
MLKFLNISKQNITILKGTLVHINAHFITDTSQSWIFSNTKAEEGICEVFIHYISAENNRKMMMEQPLWKRYIDAELQNIEKKEQFFENICEPIIHVIINIHDSYRELSNDLLDFIYGVLKKNNPNVEEIIIDRFIYTEMIESEDNKF